MSTQTNIESKLNALNPQFLEVENESYKHNVPEGAESHFKVTVVSEKFNGKMLLARHRIERVHVMIEGAEHDPSVHDGGRGLLAARPHGSFIDDGHRLADIKGTVPAPHARPAGCPFEPRCVNARTDCQQSPPPRTAFNGDRALRCYYPAGSLN